LPWKERIRVETPSSQAAKIYFSENEASPFSFLAAWLPGVEKFIYHVIARCLKKWSSNTTRTMLSTIGTARGNTHGS
jgi:hypothetical protein